VCSAAVLDCFIERHRSIVARSVDDDENERSLNSATRSMDGANQLIRITLALVCDETSNDLQQYFECVETEKYRRLAA